MAKNKKSFEDRLEEINKLAEEIGNMNKIQNTSANSNENISKTVKNRIDIMKDPISNITAYLNHSAQSKELVEASNKFQETISQAINNIDFDKLTDSMVNKIEVLNQKINAFETSMSNMNGGLKVDLGKMAQKKDVSYIQRGALGPIDKSIPDDIKTVLKSIEKGDSDEINANKVKLVLNEVLSRSDKTPSSFRASFDNMVQQAKKGAPKTIKSTLDDFSRQIRSVKSADRSGKGFTDRDFTERAFGDNIQENAYYDIAEKLVQQVPYIAEDLIENFRRVSETNSDINIIDKTNKSSARVAAQKIMKNISMGSGIFTKGKNGLVQQRLSKSGSQNPDQFQEAFNFTDQFESVVDVMRKNGINLAYELDTKGKSVKIGLYRKQDSGNVMKIDANGNTAYDWSKMASFNLGVPGRDGTFNYNGRGISDSYRPQWGYNAAKNTFEIQNATQSQVVWSNFLGAISDMENNGLLSLLQKGNNTSAERIVNNNTEKSLYASTSTETYKRRSQDVIDEANQELYSEGSDTRKMLSRERIITQDAIKKIFFSSGMGRTYTSDDSEALTDILSAIVQDKREGTFDYTDLLAEGEGAKTRKYREFIENDSLMKKMEALGENIYTNFPHFGRSSIKEYNAVDGTWAGVDTSVLNPFLATASSSFRGIQQGTNVLPLANSRKNNARFIKSPFKSNFLENQGLNQESDEFSMMMMAESSDDEIRGIMQNYYDELLKTGQIDRINSLYNKYIGLGEDDIETQVRRLKDRVLPSTKDGGMVTSIGISDGLDSYQNFNKEISLEDLKKIGIDVDNGQESIISEGKPLPFTNDPLKKKISLSNGMVLDVGDVLHAIELSPDGKYMLSGSKFTGTFDSPKTLTGTGSRNTVNSPYDEGEWNALMKGLGLENYNIQALVERDSMDARKGPSESARLWNGLLSQMLNGTGIANGISGGLTPQEILKLDDTGLLNRFLKVNDDGKTFSGKIDSLTAIKKSFTDEELQKLYGIDENSVIYNLLSKVVLSDDQTPDYDKINNYLNHRVQADSIGKANEFAYFDPIGTAYGADTQNSHARITYKQDEIIKRNANMMKLLYGEEDSRQYNGLYSDYKGDNREHLEKSEMLAGKIRKAYDSTKDSYGSKDQGISVEDIEPYLNNVEYINGQQSVEDYKNTLMGVAAQNNRPLVLDLGETLEIDNPNDPNKALGIDKLYIPSLPFENGIDEKTGLMNTPYGDISSQVQKFAKNLKLYQDFKNQDISDFSEEEKSDYDKTLTSMKQNLVGGIKNVMASYDNALNSRDGIVKKTVRDGVRVSNASALKAVSSDMESLINFGKYNVDDNTIVVSENQLKQMLMYNGRDQGHMTTNLQNLAKLSYKMQSEMNGADVDSLQAEKAQALSKIQSYSELTNKNERFKKFNELQNNLLNKILGFTNVYSENGVGFLGDFLRYPLTSDQQLTSVRVRTDKTMKDGQFWATDAIAKQQNLDWDGDTSYLEFALMKSGNIEAAYDVKQKENKYAKNVSKILGAQIRAENKANKGQTQNQKASENIKKTYTKDQSMIDFVTGLLSKDDFVKIGRISNAAFGARTGLSELYSSNNIDSFADAKIISAFFEPLEQDAISSKKVITKLVQNLNLSKEDLSGMSEDEKKDLVRRRINEQMDSIDSLTNSLISLRDVDFNSSDAKSQIENILTNIADNGFLEDKSTRQGRTLQAQLEEFAREKIENDPKINAGGRKSEYEKLLKKWGIWNSRLSDFNGNYYGDLKEEDRGDWSIDNAGKIDRNSYIEAMSRSGYVGPNKKNIFKIGNKKMYAEYGSYDKTGDEITSGLFYEYGDKNGNYGTFKKDGDKITNVNGDRPATKREEEIIKQLSSTSTENYDGQIPPTINGSDITINAINAFVNSENELITKGEPQKTQTTSTTKKDTSEKNVVDEQEQNNQNPNHNENTRKIVNNKSNAEWARLDEGREKDENGKSRDFHKYRIRKPGEDIGEIAEKDYISASKLASGVTGHSFENMVEGKSRPETVGGTYAHLRQEYLEKIKNVILQDNEALLTNDPYTRKTIKDTTNVDELMRLMGSIQTDDRKFDLDRANRFYSEDDDSFLKQQQEWKTMRVEDGFDQEEIDSVMTKASNQAEGLAKAINWLGQETVATEVSMAKDFNGQKITGTADIILYDEDSNTFKTVDYKTGKEYDDSANIQTSALSHMLEDIYKGFTSDTTIEDFKQQTLGLLNEENQQGVFNAFQKAKAKEKQGQATNFNTAVISNEGLGDGSAKLQEFNRVAIEFLNKLIQTFVDTGEAFDLTKLKWLKENSKEGHAAQYFVAGEEKQPQEKPKTSKEDFDKTKNQYVREQKKMIKMGADANLNYIKSEDTSLSKDVRESYASAANWQMQQLQLLKEQSLVLTEIDGKKVLLNQKDGTSLELNEDMVNEMQKQQEILSAENNAAFAKNKTYVSQDKQGFLGTVFNEFSSSVAHLTKTSMIYSVIGRVRGALSEMVQTIQTLDKAMTNLQIVTRSSRGELQDAFIGYNNIAQEMGVSSETVLKAADDWLRAGYSIEQSNTLIKDSLRLSVLGMMDAGEATTQLISVMKGWKLSADEMSSVVDEVTALDSAFATTSSDITTAMARANVSASMSGMDRNDYEAYIATILDVSQLAPESVGTTMKSVLARYGNVKSGKFSKYNSMEEDSEGDGFSSLNDVETVLNKVGISTRSSANTFRETDEVFEDIASKWVTMDNVTQNAITTALGGTRQREALNVLFGNWDRVGQAKDVIENSEGTSEEKYEQYTKSIEAAQNEFKNSIQAYVTGNQTLATIMTKLYNVATDLVKAIGPLAAALAGTMFLNKMGSSGFGKAGKTNPLDAFVYSAMGVKNNIFGGIRALDPRRRLINIRKEDDKYDELKNVKRGVLNNLSFLNNSENDEYLNRRVHLLSNRRIKDELIEGKRSGLKTIFEEYDNNKFSGIGDIFGSIKGKFVRSSEQTQAYNSLQGLIGNNGADFLRGLYSNGKFNEDGFLKTLNDINDSKAFDTILGRAFFKDGEMDQEKVKMLKNVMNDPTMTRYLGYMTAGELNNEYLDGLTEKDIKKISRSNWQNSEKARTMGNAFMIGSEVIGGVAQVVNKKSTTEALEGMGASSTVAATANMAATMAPAIGAAFGPMGQIVGGGISTLISVGTAIADAVITTEEEAKQIRSEINQKYDEVNKANKELSDAKTTEAKLKGLASGVNQLTGENISLSDEDYGTYQNILEDIAGKVESLNVSTDENGNKVLKCNGEVVNLGDNINALSEAIKEQAFEKSKEIFENTDLKKSGEAISKRIYTEEKQKQDIEIRKKRDSEKSVLDWIMQGWSNAGDVDSNISAETVRNISQIGNNDDYDGSIFNPTDTKFKTDKQIRDYILSEFGDDLQKSDADQRKILQISAASTEDENGRAVWQNLSQENQEQLLDSYGFLYQSSNLKQIKDAKNGKWFTNKKGQTLLSDSIQNITKWATDPSGILALNYLASNKYEDNQEKYIDYLNQKVEAAQKGIKDDEIKNAIKESFYVDAGLVQLYKADGSKIFKKLNAKNNYGIETTDNGYISKSQMDYIELNRAGVNLYKNGILSDQLTPDTLNALIQHKNDAKKENFDDISDVYNFLSKFSGNNTNTGSQAVATLKGLVEGVSGRTFFDNRELIDYINSSEGATIKKSAAYKDIEARALELGFTYVDANGEKVADLQTYLDQLDLIGDIDLNFHTNESIEDIKSQFDSIKSVLDDLESDGSLSLDGLATAVEKFGDKIFDVIDNSDELIKRLKGLNDQKYINVASSITTAMDDSKDLLGDYLNVSYDKNGNVVKRNNMEAWTTKSSEGSDMNVSKYSQLNEDIANTLKGFGSITAALELGGTFISHAKDDVNYLTGISDKSTFKSTIGKSIYSIEQDIADYFNIDLKNNANAEGDMLKAMRNQLENAGVQNASSLNYGQALAQYSSMFVDPMAQREAQLMSLNNQLAALEAAKKTAVEDHYKQEIEKVKSMADSAYSNGQMSAESYIQSLQNIKSVMGKAGLTTEEYNAKIRELNEAMEDADTKRHQYKYSLNSSGYGKNAQDYMNYLMKLASKNTADSEDGQFIISEVIRVAQDRVDYSKLQSELLEADDWEGKREALRKNKEAYQYQAAAYRALGKTKDSPEVMKAFQGYIEAEKARNQTYIDEFSALEQSWQRGNISDEEYTTAANKLIDLTKATDKTKESVSMTKEQFEELNEKIEQTKQRLLTYQVNKGELSYDEYRNKMADEVVSRNIKGSQGYEEGVQVILQSYDEQAQLMSNKQKISKGEYDYKSQKDLAQQKINLYYDEALNLAELGYQMDSKPMIEAMAKMADAADEAAQVISQQMSDYDKFYTEGYLSQGDYVNLLQELTQTENLSLDQMIEINEKVEDIAKQYYDRSFKTGNYDSVEDLILNYSNDVIKNNVVDSKEWQEGVDKIPEFLSGELSKLQKEARFADPADVKNVLSSNADIIEAAQGYIYALKNTYIEDPVTGKKISLETDKGDNVMAAKEAILDSIEAKSNAITKYGEIHENKYQNGVIGWDEYSDSIDTLIDGVYDDVKQNRATQEEVIALRGVVEKKYEKQFSNYMNYGNQSGESKGVINKNKSRDVLNDMIYSTVYSRESGEGQIEAWDRYIQKEDQLLQYNSQKRQLIDRKDYRQRLDSTGEDIDLLTNRLAHSINIFGEYSENTVETQAKIMSLLEEQNQIVQEDINGIKNDTDQGFMSYKDAYNAMREISRNDNLRGEAKREAYLSMKQMDEQYYTRYAKYDGLSLDNRMKGYLENVLTKNQYGSASYYEDLGTYISMGQEAINSAKIDAQLTKEGDWEGKTKSLNEAIDAMSRQYVVVSALQGEDSEEAKQLMLDIKGAYEEIQNFISQDMQKQQSYYQQGYLSASKYEKYLEKIQKSDDLTVDQLIEINESLEQLNTAQTQRLVQSGDYNDIWKVVNEFAEKVVSKNAPDSEAYYAGLDQIVSFIQQDMQKKQTQIDFIDPKDTKAILSGLNENAESSAALIYTLTNMSWTDSDGKAHPVATMDSDQVIQLKKQMLESYKAMSQAIEASGQRSYDEYAKGYMTISEYKQDIKELAALVNKRVSNGEATLEEVTAVKSQINNFYKSQADYDLSYSNNKSFDYFYKNTLGSYLKDVVSTEGKGEAQIQAWSQAKSMFGAYKQYTEQKASLLDPADYTNRMALVGKQIDDQTTMLAWAIKLFGENSIEAIEAESEVMTLIKSRNQIIQDSLQAIQNDSQEGYISYKDKIAKIQDIYNSSSDLDAEGKRALEQEIKRTYSDYYQNQAIRDGKTTQQAINGYLKDVVSKNVYGSEGFYESLNGLQGIMSNYTNAKKTDIQLIEKSDYDTRARGYDDLIKAQADSYAVISQIWGKDSEEAKQALLEVKNSYEEKMQMINDQLQEYNNSFSSGESNRNQLISGIERLIQTQDLTIEQFRELKKALEEAKFEALNYQKQNGIIDDKTFRKQLRDEFISKNETGSEPWIKYTESFMDSFDQEIDKLEQKRQTLGKNNVNGNIDNLNQQKNLVNERLKAMRAIVKLQAKDAESAEKILKNSKEYNQYLEKRLQIEKQIAQLNVDQSKSVMEDYNSLSEYAIELFQDQKDIVNDYYNDQIELLEQVNKQRKDSIELLKLEQKLQSAQKEKKRVYQAGVGFTYLKDQEKIKEAEEDIEDYNRNKYIEDLKSGQQKSNKQLDKLIKNWQDVQKIIKRVETTTQAQLAVNDLISKGFLDSGSTIPSALTQIMDKVKWDSNNGVIKNLDGLNSGIKIISLGAEFEDVAKAYQSNSAFLNELTTNDYVVSDSGTKDSVNALAEWLKGQAEVEVNPENDPVTLAKNAVNNATTSMNTNTKNLITEIQNHKSSVNSINTTQAALNTILSTANSKIQGLTDGVKSVFQDGFGDKVKNVTTAQDRLADAMNNLSGPNGDLRFKINELTKILGNSQKVDVPVTASEDPYILAQKAVNNMTNALGDDTKGLIQKIKNSTSKLGDLETNANDLFKITNTAKSSISTLNSNLDKYLSPDNKTTSILSSTNTLKNSIDVLNGVLSGTGKGSFAYNLQQALAGSNSSASSSANADPATSATIVDAIRKTFIGKDSNTLGLFGRRYEEGFDYKAGQTRGVPDLNNSIAEAVARVTAGFTGLTGWGNRLNNSRTWAYQKNGSTVYYDAKTSAERLNRFLNGDYQLKFNFNEGHNYVHINGADLTTINKKIQSVIDAINSLKEQKLSYVGRGSNLGQLVGTVTIGGNPYDQWSSGYLTSQYDRVHGDKPLYKWTFSEGIEKGPMTETTAAMLHGSASSPEYVLNNKQAYKLLRNMATQNINSYSQGLAESSGNSTGNTSIDSSDQVEVLVAATLRSQTITAGKLNAIYNEVKSNNTMFNEVRKQVPEVAKATKNIEDVSETCMVMLNKTSQSNVVGGIAGIATPMPVSSSPILNSDIWNLKGKVEGAEKSNIQTYQFYGDMSLPNVNNAQQFVGELLNTAKNRFNITNQRYK